MFPKTSQFHSIGSIRTWHCLGLWCSDLSFPSLLRPVFAPSERWVQTRALLEEC